MDEDPHPPGRPLRRGWTTGACATAASKAALLALLTGRAPDRVRIALPRGGDAVFAIAEQGARGETAWAAVIKDAGDDPDVTHGCRVIARLCLLPAIDGVRFRAGPGVGTVTKPGLPVPVGEPAINPVPRQMIRNAIGEVLETVGEAVGVEVTLAIEGGEALAAKTLNPRLGIVGGLSILGTTGVVIPFSCSAWIHSIHRGIDVARATGLSHVAAATGSTSERTIRDLRGLSDAALLDMGDFAGATLKYLRRHPLPRLSLAGGFAKLAKFALGAKDLHSSRSTLDLAGLADLAASRGADADLIDVVRASETGGQALAAAGEAAPILARTVAECSREQALRQSAADTAIEVVVIDRAGSVLAEARGW